MPRSLILVDVPLASFIEELFAPDCRSGPWSLLEEGSNEALQEVEGLFLYGHPIIDGPFMDRLPGLKVISNFGVGIDHVDLAAAAVRGIPVGNTPGAVEGATADMTMALLLACARNVVAGDRYARGPDYLYYDPSLFLGREVHGSTLGIVGLGNVSGAKWLAGLAVSTCGFSTTPGTESRRRSARWEWSMPV